MKEELSRLSDAEKERTELEALLGSEQEKSSMLSDKCFFLKENVQIMATSIVLIGSPKRSWIPQSQWRISGMRHRN